MRLKSIELSGFKSFARKTPLEFGAAITAIVGPNGSGKSNIAEAFRFVLGEQSMKSMRTRRGEELIWNGTTIVPRAGKASVKLVFDNTDRKLNLDFDEVSLERVVHRDGANEYLLNGSQVRLRDIAELLAGANIGASGHHIISQGEADRVLSAGSRERREMLEDALGLTAYLYKREEAERKLGKTADTMREVEALRRELIPHLKFLAAQVKKIEEGERLRSELSGKYLEYLKREGVYLRAEQAVVKEELRGPEEEKRELEKRIAHLRAAVEEKGDAPEGHELVRLEEAGRTAAAAREKATLELGRIEGELAVHERLVHVASTAVPASGVRTFAETVDAEITHALGESGDGLRRRLMSLAALVKTFLSTVSAGSDSAAQVQEELQKRKQAVESDLQDARARERAVLKDIEALRRSIESQKDASRDAERELFEAMARRGNLEGELARIAARQETLAREEERFTFEIREAGILVGREALQWETHAIEDETGHRLSDSDLLDEPRAAQEDRRRKLERLKIKVEELGTGNASEIIKEHQETTERDAFLARELQDIEATAQSLKELIDELTHTLDTRFDEGVARINAEFDAFFKLMFGGGDAALSLVKEKKLRRGLSGQGASDDADEDEDEEIEEGVDISVSLPRKRIKGLHMLSGGERALTSIALIFAMSQVNPPPFLILDETDAALDEANSRRYGDMIENLARKSQLILITHNRETMSRAGILYGITMGSDGVSKLLSVKFEEAVAVAK